MKCFRKGKVFNKYNVYLNSLKKFSKKRKFNSNDIVFVTKDSIEKFSNIDINLVLLTNVPTLEEFVEYSLKYPNKIKAYANILTHANHFPQIVKTIDDGMIWVLPNVKVKLEEKLAKKV